MDFEKMMFRTLRWAGVLSLLLVSTVGPLRAAVDEPVVKKLREAVQLPRMNMQFKFGFTDSQDWVSDPDLPDPKAELARLRGRLNNELKDAEIWLEMSRVAGQLDDPAEKGRLRMAAVGAWRKWVAAAPDDRAAQIGLGAALRLAQEFDESERILRKITSGPDAPWEAWYELATVLGEIGVRPVMIGENGNPNPLAGGPPPSAKVIEDSVRVLDEALATADQMVKLAPSEARAWSRRARIRTNRALLEFVRHRDGTEAEQSRQMFGALFPESAVPDLEVAARLRPKDPRLLMALIFHRLGPAIAEMIRSAGKDSNGELFSRLTDSQQSSVLAGLARLERLGEDDDHSLAAAAMEYQALLRMVVRGDVTGAGKAALRAVRLDPARNQAFELALALAVTAGKPDWKVAEEVVRERLKVRPDARTRFALVKVLNESGQPAPALEVVHEAMKATPGVASLEIAHLALHIRAGDYPGGQEGPNMESIGRAMEALPDGEEKMLLMRNYYITGAALAALGNDLAGSRQLLKKFLDKVADDDYANAIDALVKQMN